MRSDPNFIPLSAGGEACRICGNPAHRKVEEHVFDDDPMPVRHPFTAYLCLYHFNKVMGLPHVGDWRHLFEAIKHGDNEHQKWLREALRAYFTGQEIPKPGDSDAA